MPPTYSAAGNPANPRSGDRRPDSAPYTPRHSLRPVIRTTFTTIPPTAPSNGSDTSKGHTLGAATLTSVTTTTADLDRVDVDLAKTGDAGAFERIYRRHAARVHSLCARMLSPQEADDAAQEVFIRAWQKLALFRGEAAFGTWLHRLAVNLLIGRRQTQSNYRDRFGADSDDLVVPGRGDRPDLRVDFEAALQTLPPRAKQVFVLHDVEGYRHDEIGEMLGINTGTSKSQLHRARMSLRQYLQ
jgi:RNA polymerase sigma factor (sigma-70 family)